MTISASSLAASTLIGAASGMRSTVALGTLIVRSRGDELPLPLRLPLAKRAATSAVMSEFALDKLPFTGSRLEAGGLAGRVVFAAATAALVARRDDEPLLPATVAAVLAALVAAKVAHDLREQAAQRYPAAAVAVAEDAASLAVAALAVRR